MGGPTRPAGSQELGVHIPLIIRAGNSVPGSAGKETDVLAEMVDVTDRDTNPLP